MGFRDATEAARALAMQKSGFLDLLKQADWRIIGGRLEKNQELDEQSLRLTLWNAK